MDDNASSGPYRELPTHESVSFSWGKFFRVWFGPGLLMSIAYVDPGNLEGDLQSGASAGYVLLWVLLWGTVLGFVIQMQAAKLGIVTGRNLAEHCAASFPPLPRHVLWVMAEVAIIGSDMQEVTGSAIALLLLSRGGIPLWAGVLLSAVGSFLLLLVERAGARWLEALFGVFIAAMVAAFAYCFSRAGVPALEVAEGFLFPRLPGKAVGQAVALLGSLIMPHNLYLHSALVQTRRIDRSSEAAKREALMYVRTETALALSVSVVVNMFVMCVFAAGFHGRGIDDIGLENAGHYLGLEYGQSVVVLWALGLLAAGQSSTMTGTFAGQHVMSGFLDIQLQPWLRVVVTRCVALGPTLAVATLASSSTALDSLNQVLNLLQSVQLPFALLPLLVLNSSEALLGKAANSRATNTLAGTVSVALICINLAGVYAFLGHGLVGRGPWLWALVGAAAAAYLGFIMYITRASLRWVDHRRRAQASAGAGDAARADEEEDSGGAGDTPREADALRQDGDRASLAAPLLPDRQ